MTDAETAARGQRAEALKSEFIDPILANIKAEYLARIADVAVKELDPKVRADKLTSLSFALRIYDNVAEGLNAAILDGKAAQTKILRANEIENMKPSKRRLLQIAPSY